MSKQTFDLGQLFQIAQQAMAANRQQVNDLDGYNGNHGDNMVENLKMIADALQTKQGQPPAQALQYAGERLAQGGRGGTSRYYAQGLMQAANQVQGKTSLGQQDIVGLIETLLGAIPAEATSQPETASESVLERVAGLALQKQAEPEPAEDAFDMGDLLESLIPAGMAFLQARQSGSTSSQALQKALIGALIGGKVQPQQTNTPRAAAGSLIAQSVLQALMGRK